ncbi:hypothetical protein [Cryobacterium tagatosivorans]|uniref:Uncharacterized protein n=1 Tax=Cryobacterium tagatosivorans TaxID=1259199 RepID=A0A4R8UD62_9MICO|nr:hypothetical protein [Cryobacterium tagatosivorans]TFB48147.1 hypothetical protein E3O23_13970 [Cryobacterium tagatosivorans]
MASRQAALRPFSEPGGCINFMDADVLGRITGKHGANCARLAVVMASGYLFHVNQNIKQADGPPMLSSFQDDSG